MELNAYGYNLVNLSADSIKITIVRCLRSFYSKFICCKTHICIEWGFLKHTSNIQKNSETMETSPVTIQFI